MNRKALSEEEASAAIERQMYWHMAEDSALAQNLRLEDDGKVYNAFGIAVAEYLGGSTLDGAKRLHFRNLPLETEWENAKVLKRDDGYGK